MWRYDDFIGKLCHFSQIYPRYRYCTKGNSNEKRQVLATTISLPPRFLRGRNSRFFLDHGRSEPRFFFARFLRFRRERNAFRIPFVGRKTPMRGKQISTLFPMLVSTPRSMIPLRFTCPWISRLSSNGPSKEAGKPIA